MTNAPPSERPFRRVVVDEAIATPFAARWRPAPSPTAPLEATQVTLEERVGPPQQNLVLGVALDHVGEITQVVEQELDGALAPPRAPHHAQHVDHDVLELRSLDVDGHLEGPLERHAAGPHLAQIGGEKRPQPGHRMLVEPDAGRRRAARIGLHDALDQGERAAVPRLVTCHREPEVAHLLGPREGLHEGDVQRHRLLLELDGDVEHLADGRAARSPTPRPEGHRPLLSKGRARL